MLMRNTSRLGEHQRRVDFLKTLAQLVGYSVSLPCLPGGSIPDVLQYSPGNHGLFVGDAKNTETPFNQLTQVRLLRYLLSLSAYLRTSNSHCVFAVCFGNYAQRAKWEE